MAKDKKSFLLYCDQIGLFNKLPDELAGKLIKHIFSYVNDENPECDDLLLNIAFEPIKTQLKRDLQKYEQFIDKQRDNGLKGGRPKKPNETQKTQPFIEKPKKPDNDTDIDNGIDKVIVKDNSKDYQLCVDFWLKEFHVDFSFNATSGKKMKSIITKIKKLMKDGNKPITDEAVLQSFRYICHKLPEWYKDKDLAVIDSKFNEIIAEIKNGTSKIDKSRNAAEDAVRILTGEQLR